MILLTYLLTYFTYLTTAGNYINSKYCIEKRCKFATTQPTCCCYY